MPTEFKGWAVPEGWSGPMPGGNDKLGSQLGSASKAISSFVAVINQAAKDIRAATKGIDGKSESDEREPRAGQRYLSSRDALKQAGSNALSSAGAALTEGAGIGGAAKAGLQGAAATFGGGVAGGLTLVGLAAVEAGKELQKMSERARQFHSELAKASPAMAAEEARRNVNSLLRERDVGNRLAGSARALNDAEQFKEDQKKELRILGDRVQAGLATGWERVKGVFYAPFNKIAAGINKLVDNTDKSKPLSADQWAEKLAEEDRKWREDWHRQHPGEWERPNDPTRQDRGDVGGAWGGGGDFR